MEVNPLHNSVISDHLLPRVIKEPVTAWIGLMGRPGYYTYNIVEESDILLIGSFVEYRSVSTLQKAFTDRASAGMILTLHAISVIKILFSCH